LLNKKPEAENRATRVVAATLGSLVGLAGIDHGIFEVLQGHVPPSSFLIAAIGPEQRFWFYGEETALTIIPSFFGSGILSVTLGILVTVWAIRFVDRKYGGGILMLLFSLCGFAHDIQEQVGKESYFYE
jgi:hypothetical protein